MKKRALLSPWFALILMFFAQLIASIGNLSVAPLSPFFQEEYNTNYLQIGMLTSVLSIGACLFAIPGGWLVDKFGIKKSLSLFGILIGISYCLLGIVNSYILILFLLLLIGICYGAMTPITTKSVVEWFAYEKRGFAMSVKQTGVVGGGAIASFLIVYFGSLIGWKLTVIILGILFLLIYIILAILYNNPITNQEKREVQSPSVFLKDIKLLLKNKHFMLLCFVMCLFLWGQFSLSTFLLLFLNESLYFSLFLSGFGLSVFLIGGVTGRIFWGWISDLMYQDRREYVVLLNAFLGFVSFVILGIFNSYGISIPEFVIIITLFLAGINIAGWNGVMITIIVGEVIVERAGLASGISYAIGNTGTMIGVPITGLIIEYAGYTVSFLLLGFIYIIIVYLLKNIIKRKRYLCSSSSVEMSRKS